MMRSYGSIFVLCVLLLGHTALPATADSSHADHNQLRDLLPALGEDRIEELIETGELSHMIEPDEGPELVPGEYYRRSIEKDLESVEYTVGVEVLNLMPANYGDFDTLTAGNLLLELSTLEGLEYYSSSRETMRTLFVQSFAIDDAEGGNRIADPAVDTVPAAGEVFMFQEDMTFGKNRLRIDYRITDSTIHMVSKNITTFSWGPIPLIRPDRLRLHVFVYKTDNFILYYGNFGAKAIDISILRKRIYNSFYNRLLALYGWFEEKLLEESAEIS